MTRAEESKYNLYSAVQLTGKQNEAAFEAGKELTLLYVADTCIQDLEQYLANGIPVTENPRPEEDA